MDQGVIRSLKAHHRKNVVRKIIRSLEKKTLPKISSILGMQILVATWDAATTKTVVICFRKSKISSECQRSAIAEDNDPFTELEEEIKNLRSIQPDLVPENMDAASFTDVDAEVLVVQRQPSAADIVAELLETEDVLE